jgi:hypothetical protein
MPSSLVIGWGEVGSRACPSAARTWVRWLAVEGVDKFGCRGELAAIVEIMRHGQRRSTG